MQTAINQFRVNIGRVRNLDAVYKTSIGQTTAIPDLSDILRAELVMAVSALDHYIHEMVRLGMLEAYSGHRIQTPAFLRFQVTLSAALQGISAPMSDDWLEEQIRTRHSYQSFQHPDNIANAIRLISDVQLWNEVGKHIGIDAQDVKEELIAIVDRRNKIAHEADMDTSFSGELLLINDVLVDDAINFIEQIAEAIYAVVS
ncbi:hypothetical protein H8E77_02515 [bacterium]|nr:hypothetical protein [bacterium]